MFKKISCLLLTVMLLICSAQPSTAIANSENAVATSEKKIYCTATLDSDFADNHVLVVMTNAASLSSQTRSITTFSEIDLKSVQSLMPYTDSVMAKKTAIEKGSKQLSSAEAAALTSVSTADYHQILRLELKNPGKENVLAAIKELEQRADVLCAEPDYYLYTSADPDDTYRDDQWAINKIGLPNAWNVTTGSANVSVGIIDSGIATIHPDLDDRIDPDTTLSTSFHSTGEYNIDSLGHGTEVAGVIAAQTDNEAGISGVCWNIDLVSLKITNAATVSISAIPPAIDYAREHEIDILNCSLNTRGLETPSLNEIEVLRIAIARYNGLFICSAGNHSLNLESTAVYPPEHTNSNIIVVGSSTENDTMATHSNYGRTRVDLFAPGEGILTTANCLTGCTNCNSGTPGYHSVSGTSLAAPYVAGVAALVKSKYPNLTSSQIKQRIMLGVIDVRSNGASVFGDLCVSGGRLNAYRAVHDHTCTYTDLDYPTTHLAFCTDPLCGVNFYEDHTFILSGVGYECSTCGYYTEILP